MDLTPKEFEQLLCEFCKQDLPTNFTVEHDIKDIGKESGQKRQIDTKIKGRLGISNILICGEAKNWNSVVGIETIDGLIGKYSTGEIHANKIIVFSNQGYTESAIVRAKHLGIELLEPLKIGKPIIKIPHIVGVGYLGQMKITISKTGSPQKTLMAIDPDDYIIIKGSEKISFQQNVFRILISTIGKIKNKNIFSDLSTLYLKDKNVLYELKQKEGYRYDADFEIEVSINWDYFLENLDAGILRHLNSDDIKFVNLQGKPEDVLSKVLLSPTKVNYEQKDKCIREVVEKNIRYVCQFCLSDPDQNKTNPDVLTISFV